MAKARSGTYDRDRAYRLLRAYGITLEEYDALKEAQGGTCAICKRARGISTPLEVDHDHSMQGRESVRGLVCNRDNNRIGWLEAKRDRILDYLDNPPARKVLK